MKHPTYMNKYRSPGNQRTAPNEHADWKAAETARLAAAKKAAEKVAPITVGALRAAAAKEGGAK